MEAFRLFLGSAIISVSCTDAFNTYRWAILQETDFTANTYTKWRITHSL